MGILAPTLYFLHVISLKISTQRAAMKIENFFDLTGKLLTFMIGSLVQESNNKPICGYKCITTNV